MEAYKILIVLFLLIATSLASITFYPSPPSYITIIQNNSGNGTNGTGPAGPQGPAGTNGTNGINGTNGLNGTNGIDGLNGTNGLDGLNGTNGTNGLNGTNGTNGSNSNVSCTDSYLGCDYSTPLVASISFNTTTGDLRYRNDTYIVGVTGNWTGDKSLYALITNLAAYLGNWSADKPDYTPYANLAISINNGTIARTGTATCAGTTLAQNVTTTTSGITSQCVQPAAGAESDPMWSGNASGIQANISAINGTAQNLLTSNTTTNQRADELNTSALNATLARSQLNTSINLKAAIADLTTLVGNWSLDKPSYVALSNLVAQVGNWSLERTAVIANLSLLSQNITNVNTSVINASLGISQLNTSTANIDSLLSANITNVNASANNGTLARSQLNKTTVMYTTQNYSTTSNTVYTNITQLAYTLNASSWYAMNCNLLVNSSLATTGTQIRVNTTGTPNVVVMAWLSTFNASDMESFSGSAKATNTFADLGSAAGMSIGQLNGYVATSASVSLFTLEIKSEVSGSAVAIVHGSICSWMKLA